MPVRSGKVEADILLQSLSELIVRNKYGSTQLFNQTGVYLSGGLNTLINISGKGIIYGGFIHDEKDPTDYPVITIDGTAVSGRSFSTLNSLNIDKPNAGINYLMDYDTVGQLGSPYYTMGIIGGITFETSFKLQMYFWNTLTYINSQFLYATI